VLKIAVCVCVEAPHIDGQEQADEWLFSIYLTLIALDTTHCLDKVSLSLTVQVALDQPNNQSQIESRKGGDF